MKRLTVEVPQEGIAAAHHAGVDGLHDKGHRPLLCQLVICWRPGVPAVWPAASKRPLFDRLSLPRKVLMFWLETTSCHI